MSEVERNENQIIEGNFGGEPVAEVPAEPEPEHVAAEPPTEGEPAQPQAVELTIQLALGTGQVAVRGPIHDRILVKGMLSEASRAIDEWHAKQNRVVVPPNGFRIPKGLLKR